MSLWHRPTKWKYRFVKVGFDFCFVDENNPSSEANLWKNENNNLRKIALRKDGGTATSPKKYASFKNNDLWRNGVPFHPTRTFHWIKSPFSASGNRDYAFAQLCFRMLSQFKWFLLSPTKNNKWSAFACWKDMTWKENKANRKHICKMWRCEIGMHWQQKPPLSNTHISY